MEFIYEDFYGMTATVEEYYIEDFNGNPLILKGMHVYAKNIFLHFLSEVLEKHGVEYNYWESTESKLLEFDTCDHSYLKEAKEEFNKFFGDGEEREAKFSMFLSNEELFKNIYDFKYQESIF